MSLENNRQKNTGIIPAKDGSANGGRFGHANHVERTGGLPRADILNDPEKIQEINARALRASHRTFYNNGLHNKSAVIDADDAVQDGWVSILTPNKAGVRPIDRANDTGKYLTTTTANSAKKSTALTRNPSNLQALRDYTEIVEMERAIFGDELPKEFSERKDLEDMTESQKWVVYKDELALSIVKGWEDPKSAPSMKFRDRPATTPSLDMEIGSSDESTGATLGDALDGNNLGRMDAGVRAIQEAYQPELAVMVDDEEEVERLAQIMDIIESRDRRASNNAKRSGYNALAHLYKLPTTEGVQHSQRKVTAIFAAISEPSTLMQVYRTWQMGETSPETEMFFAPFGDIDEGERDKIVDFFKQHRAVDAYELWKSTMASTNNNLYRSPAKAASRRRRKGLVKTEIDA